jgi:hypothetical protein
MGCNATESGSAAPAMALGQVSRRDGLEPYAYLRRLFGELH